MSAISLNTLRKSYDGHEIVHGIDLDIEEANSSSSSDRPAAASPRF